MSFKHDSEPMHTNQIYRLEISTWGTGRLAVGIVQLTSDNHGRSKFHRLSMTFCKEEGLWDEVGSGLTLIRAKLLEDKHQREYQPDITGLVGQEDEHQDDR